MSDKILTIETFGKLPVAKKHKALKVVYTDTFEDRVRYQAQVNRADIRKLIVMDENEKEIVVSRKLREDFVFTGLSTWDFVSWVIMNRRKFK
jgi:hypothetical protein